MAPEQRGPGRPDDDRTFDEIVQQLNLDLSFPAQEPEAAREPEPVLDPGPEDAVPFELDEVADDRDDQFYRRVDPGPVRPWTGQRLLATAAVLGPPLLLVLCTLSGFWLPRTVVVGAGLIFVAGSIWWIAQLPEHGPGRPDWPDDGAAL